MIEVKFYKDGEEYKPTPIEVATMLIGKKEEQRIPKDFNALFKKTLLNTIEENESTKIEVDYFTVYDLKEIADHIQATINRLEIQFAIKESEANKDE